MPFQCRADDYVVLDPPGHLGGLEVTSLEAVEEREDGLYAFVESRADDGPVRLAVVFEGPWAYCVSNESQRIRTAHRIVAAIGKAGLLHRVDGSEWLERFVEESDRTCVGPLQHYLIVTGDDWLDVVAQKPPAVRIL